MTLAIQLILGLAVLISLALLAAPTWALASDLWGRTRLALFVGIVWRTDHSGRPMSWRTAWAVAGLPILHLPRLALRWAWQHKHCRAAALYICGRSRQYSLGLWYTGALPTLTYFNRSGSLAALDAWWTIRLWRLQLSRRSGVGSSPCCPEASA